MSISTITSSLGDIGSKFYGASSAITRNYQDQTETLERVFSNLDTEGKGYLDAGDFETAFAALGLGESEDESDGNLTLPGVEDVVAALDMDGDGKISSEDLTEGVSSLTDSLSFLQGRAEVLGAEVMQFAQTFDSQLADEEAEAQQATEAAATATAESVSREQTRPDLFVMRRVMQLMDAYGSSYRANESSESLSLVA
jgi:Ca2+-binding EF-hand superfamily protein